MLILAIDTSARHFSLALLDEQIPIARFDSRDSEHTGGIAKSGNSAMAAGSPSQGVSATLFPAIRDLFAETNFDLGDIEAIVVSGVTRRSEWRSSLRFLKSERDMVETVLENHEGRKSLLC